VHHSTLAARALFSKLGRKPNEVFLQKNLIFGTADPAIEIIVDYKFR
jgi:hypothetical protein